MEAMRLIDADALIEKCEVWTGHGWQHSFCLEKDIRKAPTVDAEPVLHGEWKERPINVGTPETDLFCSVCDFPSWNRRYKFCPSCGARMDGGRIG